MERIDLSEYEKLESQFDVEAVSLSFEDSGRIFYDFLKQVLLTDIIFRELHIDENTKKLALLHLEKIGANLDGSISPADLAPFRAQAWEENQKHQSPKSDLFRVIVCGLYDKAMWEKDLEYAQDDHLGLIICLLYKLDKRFAKQFREFVETHTRMANYKLSD